MITRVFRLTEASAKYIGRLPKENAILVVKSEHKVRHLFIDALEVALYQRGDTKPAFAAIGDYFKGMVSDQAFREKIGALNREPGIVTARFTHGFFAADVSEGFGTTLVITDNDLPRAKALADELAEEIYAKRRSFYRDCLAPDEALQEAKRLLDAGVHPPIVLADVNDNPGSGSTQDNPELLRAMIRADLPSMLSVLYDPESVERAYEAGLGNEVVLDLGGKLRPDVTGGPVTAKAKVLQFSDGNYRNEGNFLHGVLHRLGKAALVAVGNVQIVLSSIRVQPADRAALHLFGLEPETCPIVAVKSAVHYRASYEPVAGRILEVETKSLGPIDPRALSYQRAPRP